MKSISKKIILIATLILTAFGPLTSFGSDNCAEFLNPPDLANLKTSLQEKYRRLLQPIIEENPEPAVAKSWAQDFMYKDMVDAINSNDLYTLRSLIELGVDVNYRDWDYKGEQLVYAADTALSFAVQNNNLLAADILIKAGARNIGIQISPLNDALRLGYIEMAKLIAARADLNAAPENVERVVQSYQSEEVAQVIRNRYPEVFKYHKAPAPAVKVTPAKDSSAAQSSSNPQTKGFLAWLFEFLRKN